MAATAAAFPLLTSIGAGAIGSVVAGAILKPDAPAAAAAAAPAPPVTPPTPMPDAEATRQAAARASLLDQVRRRGRASTILTDPSAVTTDPLGGS